MSYGFDMCFRSCPSLNVAFLLARLSTETCYANLRELLEREYVFIPSVRYSISGSPDAANELWLTRLLQMDYVFWPKYNLLALVGAAWPKAVMEMFSNQVYFQNSCDQDYDFSDWEGLSAPFRKISKTCQQGKLSDVEAYMQLGRHSPEDYSFENYGCAESYYRRSAAYNGIFETLRLEKWLWGQEDESFFRFTMTPLNCVERSHEAVRLMRALLHTNTDEKD